MSISEPFIRRPIATSLLPLGIVVPVVPPIVVFVAQDFAHGWIVRAARRFVNRFARIAA